MELRQIEYFLAVLKHKSYTRAANSLFISQPTLSVAIQKLENELGLKLLDRDNKGITLTKYGAAFQERAEKLLGDADALMGLMRDMNPSLKKKRQRRLPLHHRLVALEGAAAYLPALLPGHRACDTGPGNP